MAGTVTATLTLAGQGVTSDPIAIAPTVTLHIDNPCVESGSLITPPLAAGPYLLTTAASDPMYLYIKNTGIMTAGALEVRIGGVVAANIKQGAWMWIPVENLAAIEYDTEAFAAVAVPFEYAFWASV
jgi:hypothetical protein